MNILAVDYGKKRLGLAWTDTALGVVLPYGVIEAKDTNDAITKITGLIKSEKIQKMVVGWPLNLEGKESKNTSVVNDFCERLEAAAGMPVTLVDERFTSREAGRLGGEASTDEKAAMIILQTYLDTNK